MATYLEMQNEVLAYGFDATAYRARIKSWLNEAQSRIARTLEIPELYTQSTITTIVGTTTYTKPTDLIRLKAITDPALDNLTFEPDYDEVLLDNSANPTNTGRPVEFSIAPTGIILSPVPDAVYSLTLTYYKRPTDLSVDSDVSTLPVDYHDVMVSYTLQRSYRSEDDAEMATFYYNEYWKDLRQLGTDRQTEVQTTPRQVRGSWQ